MQALPKIAEFLPGCAMANWKALNGPPGLADPAVARLNTAMRQALADPELAANLRRHGGVKG